MTVNSIDMTPVGGLITPPKRGPKRKPPVVGGLITPPGRKPKPPFVTSGMITPPKKPEITPEEFKTFMKVMVALMAANSCKHKHNNKEKTEGSRFSEVA